MPVITYIARQIFTYPFVVKVWEKATAKEALQFWSIPRLPYSKRNANRTRSS